MLFKLSVNSIRKSLRDYAIYFFTLVLGVSIFYVFNAISGQVAFMELEQDTTRVSELFNNLLSSVSVLVSIILGLLVVYASRFIMKRRHKEFALYMTLGMSKSKISIILLIETILIGIGSIVVGLLLGIGLSQLMSAMVANLFDADMSKYKFTVPGAAIGKTIIYFVIIYVVVMVLQNLIISRLKLIDLIRSGKKSEQVKLKNPIICVVVFVLAAIALGFTYCKLNVGREGIMQNSSFLPVYLAIMAVATFFIFWSLAGLILRIVSSMKKTYFKRLNSFTFRQISSRINTMVMSMTLICMMLFVTILAISIGYAAKDNYNLMMKSMPPADIEMSVHDNHGEKIKNVFAIDEKLKENKIDISSYLESHLSFYEYVDESKDDPNIPYIVVIKLSDYNTLMKMYGQEQITLGENEFVYLSSFDGPFNEPKDATLWGHKLHALNGKKPFNKVFTYGTNHFVVPDNIVDENSVLRSCFIGMYKGDKKATEKQVRNYLDEKMPYSSFQVGENSGHPLVAFYNTRIKYAQDNILNGASFVLIAIYLGLVFLIACGALLALKELSDSIDNVERYNMLRKIGAEEKDISKSLFWQIGFFFMIPLLVACVHAAFSWNFVLHVLSTLGMMILANPILVNALVLILVYGGYFLITYLCSRSIIRNRR